MRKKNRTGGIKLSVFRLYYKAGVIKPVKYRHQNKLIDQWNRIEIQEINSYTYGQLIESKGEKNIQRIKDSLFNKWCWEDWIVIFKRMKLEYSLPPNAKISSKWIKT